MGKDKKPKGKDIDANPAEVPKDDKYLDKLGGKGGKAEEGDELGKMLEAWKDDADEQ